MFLQFKLPLPRNSVGIAQDNDPTSPSNPGGRHSQAAATLRLPDHDEEHHHNDRRTSSSPLYDLTSVERGRNTSTSPLYDSATTADTSTGSTENYDHNLAAAESAESHTDRVSRTYIIKLVLCVSALVLLFGSLTTVILIITIKSGMQTA